MDASWIQLCTSFIPQISRNQWDAVISILVEKPQSVDKRVAGQISVSADSLSGDQQTQHINKQIEHLRDQHQSSCENFIVQKLVSRNPKKFPDWYRVVLVSDFSAAFLPLNLDADVGVQYRILICSSNQCNEVQQEGKVVLETGPGLQAQQQHWLQQNLIKSVTRWLQDNITGLTPASLNLIDLQNYYSEYNKLKSKYAGDLISNWKESSDPEKSVHEDIGIAAYLICLWGDKKVSFVDLGCGNGLLVYLLNSEGHKGQGIDLRKRKIWSTFPTLIQDNLLEQAVKPGIETVFPQTDWILGNHSDELTPWIPVFACLSSENTNFWVLPCCPFSLTAKYQRKNASRSIFRDFLDYVTELGTMAGFKVAEDKMRIPSTKRICLVGKPDSTDFSERKKKVLEYVSIQMEKFKPREKVERVRNCTKIGQDIIEAIVQSVFKLCLETRREVKNSQGEAWNSGGQVMLGDVIAHLKKQNIDLSRLKAECGGLQTLLKNNHSIFCVEKGKVSLRIPSGALPKHENAKIKRKACFFHDNHPDGCPLKDSECTWIHL